nr:hypothetical protein [Tanacetum cinerariifolium]
MRHNTSSYSNQPQRESINLINVINNSSEDFLDDLFSDQPSGNPTFSSHPELTSPEVNDDIFDLEGGNVLSEKLLDLDSTKDLHPPLHVNPLSGSTTYSFSPNQLLEMFTDKHALDYSSPPLYDEYDDDLQFDIESDLKEIEILLYQDIDSSLKDSSDLANPADDVVDSMPEMFTDEHALDYSSPPIFDEYDDDFLEVESDVENVYDDPFDSKAEKIKESKLLIDELDLPCDFPPSDGISIPLAVRTPSTGSGNLYCQWELSPSSGNALCILFLTCCIVSPFGLKIIGDEEVVVREGVMVTSSSLEMLTNSCLGGIIVSLIFLEGLVEEALEDVTIM